MAAVAAALLVAVGGAELAARTAGLHAPLLYDVTDYGYRVRPGQSLVRLGNRVEYDAQGLRSAAVATRPAAGTLRVLCLGDSITNGGTLTDQPDTYPLQLQRRLREAGVAAEVLNASAAGWAPGNEAGWIEANGLQGAAVLVLEVATHDLFQPPAQADLVGRHPSFPARAPFLALQEVVGRYVLPRLVPGLRVADPGTEDVDRSPSRVAENLERIDRVIERARREGAKVIVMHVPQPEPLEPRDAATRDALHMLAQRVAAQGVAWLPAGEAIASGGGRSLFRDAFHPNPAGNAVLAEAVASRILEDAARAGSGGAPAPGGR